MSNPGAKNEEKSQLQLGVLDADLVLRFRAQTAERKFKKLDVLRIMVTWWLSMDHEEQKALYFVRNNDLQRLFEAQKKRDLPRHLVPILQQVRKLSESLPKLPETRKRTSGS